jgi:hypothetical protein
MPSDDALFSKQVYGTSGRPYQRVPEPRKHNYQTDLDGDLIVPEGERDHTKRIRVLKFGFEARERHNLMWYVSKYPERYTVLPSDLAGDWTSLQELEIALEHHMQKKKETNGDGATSA